MSKKVLVFTLTSIFNSDIEAKIEQKQQLLSEIQAMCKDFGFSVLWVQDIEPEQFDKLKSIYGELPGDVFTPRKNACTAFGTEILDELFNDRILKEKRKLMLYCPYPKPRWLGVLSWCTNWAGTRLYYKSQKVMQYLEEKHQYDEDFALSYFDGEQSVLSKVIDMFAFSTPAVSCSAPSAPTYLASYPYKQRPSLKSSNSCVQDFHTTPNYPETTASLPQRVSV